MQDIVIIGAGTAGLTAAIYAARAGKTVTVLENESIGGQISTSPRVENYPGYESISGSAFADKLCEQALALGVQVEPERATSVQDNGKTKTVVTTTETYDCRAVILATGVKHRHLGLPEETDFLGRGLSYCAICDGAFFRNKTVAVVGGGNSALQSAIYLSEICETVYLIHRRAEFRAEAAVVQQLQEKPNIRLCLQKTVVALQGEPLLASLTLQDTQTQAQTSLAVSGLFVSVGQVPANAFLQGLVRLDENGFLLADESCLTNVPGVFAAGDCRTKAVRQLTTAAADGSVAAIAACNYIAATEA